MKKIIYCIFIFFLFTFILHSETPDTYIPEEKTTINNFYIPGNEGDIIYSIAEGIVKDLSFDNNKGLFIIVDYKLLFFLRTRPSAGVHITIGCTCLQSKSR